MFVMAIFKIDRECKLLDKIDQRLKSLDTVVEEAEFMLYEDDQCITDNDGRMYYKTKKNVVEII